jgi:hypothetical protein
MEQSAIGHEVDLMTALPEGGIISLKTDRTIYGLKRGWLFATW